MSEDTLSPLMARQHVVGRFYALPASREFELHQVAAGVLSGRIALEIPAAQFAQFNGTGARCSCVVSGIPLTLVSIQAAPALDNSDEHDG